jgi:hypothetical protein
MLTNADELVEFYDPTDVFGDLADSLAEAYPSVAPELGGDGVGPARAAASADRVADAEANEDVEDVEDVEDADETEDKPTA